VPNKGKQLHDLKEYLQGEITCKRLQIYTCMCVKLLHLSKGYVIAMLLIVVYLTI